MISTVRRGLGDLTLHDEHGDDDEKEGDHDDDDDDEVDDDDDDANLPSSMGVQVEGERLISTLLVNNAVEVGIVIIIMIDMIQDVTKVIEIGGALKKVTYFCADKRDCSSFLKVAF